MTIVGNKHRYQKGVTKTELTIGQVVTKTAENSREPTSENDKHKKITQEAKQKCTLHSGNGIPFQNYDYSYKMKDTRRTNRYTAREPEHRE